MTVGRYKKFVKPYLYAFILGPILMIVEVLGEVLLPKFMSNIINIGVAEGDVRYIVLTGLAMIGTALLMMTGGVGGNFFATKASVGFAAGLRQELFEKVQSFSFANIEKFSTGSLVTRLTNDVTQIQNIIRMSLILMLRAPGMLIGALIMALLINAELARVVLIVIPILTILLVTIMRIGFPRFQLMQKKIDALNSNIQENVTNVRVVKSFVREDFEREKFGFANQELMDKSINGFKVVIMSMPLMMLAMNVTTLSVVWLGGRQILFGTIQVGDLTAFTTYIVQILMSLMMVAMILLQSSRALASEKRIREVLDEVVDLTNEEAEVLGEDPQVKEGRVEFRHVNFRYYKNNKNNVLQDINLTFEPGSVVGIIGSTGSGKTSLVQLIPRLYDANEGEVLVDGINVKKYDLEHLRTEVGMVLQQNVLFSGTIMENLRWGDVNASEEEIKAMAEAAQANGFVEGFTDGYETELGQGGVNVSGGQKQRLCIARALLKRPKILILDDSTSAVDTATEAKIRESFYTTLKDTTKIIIAQRISSVLEADQIVVMDEGSIVGVGVHDTLLKECEAYQEIYYSQMDKEEVTA